MQPRKRNRKRKEEFSFKILFRSVHAFSSYVLLDRSISYLRLHAYITNFYFFIVSPEKNPIITYQLQRHQFNFQIIRERHISSLNLSQMPSHSKSKSNLMLSWIAIGLIYKIDNINYCHIFHINRFRNNHLEVLK